MGTMGVWTPVKQAYIHQVIPSEQRATVVGGLITVAVLPVVFKLRHLNKPADFITGSE